MTITNNAGLPKVFLDFAKADKYSRGDADISVTQLIDSPRVRMMKEHYRDALTSDVSDMIWALFGTAVHHVLETAKEEKGVVMEQRMMAEVNGWTLSGAVDYQRVYPVGDGTGEMACDVIDYKVTSVWSVIYGKEDWVRQLNCYAYLIEKNKSAKVKNLQICAICRDWNRRDAMMKPDYPQQPVVLIDIPLWSEDERRGYVEGRIAMHQEAQMKYDLDQEWTLCSNDERWAKPDTFAVKAKNRKRALRVLPTREAAEDYINNSEDKNLVIEHRVGEFTRCSNNYCGVADKCGQWMGDRPKTDW